MAALQALQDFLKRNKIPFKLIKDDTSLENFIEKNFAIFDERVLRGIVDEALRTRELSSVNKNSAQNKEELLGVWATVIDSVRTVTARRKDEAVTNFQKLIAIANDGGIESSRAELGRLFREGRLDAMFTAVLSHTLEHCKQGDGHPENVAMLEFFQDTIKKLHEKAVSLAKAVSAATASKAAEASESTSAIAVAQGKGIAMLGALPGEHVAGALATTKTVKEMPVETAAPPPPQPVAEASPPPAAATTATTTSSSKPARVPATQAAAESPSPAVAVVDAPSAASAAAALKVAPPASPQVEGLEKPVRVMITEGGDSDDSDDEKAEEGGKEEEVCENEEGERRGGGEGERRVKVDARGAEGEDNGEKNKKKSDHEAHDEKEEEADDDDEDDEDEEEDEEDRAETREAELMIARLVEAGMLLDRSIKECQGDASRLKALLRRLFDEGRIDEAFHRVLGDNLLACQEAGYVNKEKLLNFVRALLQGFQQERHRLAGGGLGGVAGGGGGGEVAGHESRPGWEGASAGEDSGEGSGEEKTALFATHHAPQFVDRVGGVGGGKNAGVGSEGGAEAGAIAVVAPKSFIDSCLDSAGLLDAALKTKKKSLKKAAKRKAGVLADKLGQHLQQHGWAACDRFLPLDLVRRVRIESGLFVECFEQSEIWVGKDASVGAQVSVPSVRGDKVLWMCGGHTTAPEGVTRAVQTKGEVEPCRLEVKAKAPIRRFAAMKELLQYCDRLMEALKPRVARLKGVYERSDAMLAIYPGEGARFANHIDNTTSDGRRLTLLIYLNPSWRSDQGGALRVTEPETGKQVDIYPEAGRLAMFWSAEVAHEVRPTYGDRHAITIWYYDAEERAEALKKAREQGRGAGAGRAGEAAQAQAQRFIADLMGGDEVGADGGDPTSEDLQALATKVASMSDDALGIVASITGAQSSSIFREGFASLTPADLKNMRQMFRRMGLK